LFNEVNYPATAEVMEKARIAIIRNEDLEKVLKAHPSMAVAIIKVLNKRLYGCSATGKKPGLCIIPMVGRHKC
jgi:CRP-like cAMP-binding protein